MDILNLFFIGIILYLCYKIITVNELFQTKQSSKIDLSGKKIIFNRNLAINMNENKLEELNKLDIDLSKNNLLIDNKYNNKIAIKKELCIGNFCINKDKLKLIGGKIDAPQFYKTNNNGIADTKVYYNHDCNITNKNSKYCNINSVKDLPEKLCFNYEDENAESKQNKLCIGTKEFDILKGKRGIKLKNIDSNKKITSTPSDSEPQKLENNYTYDKYLMPYYADFRETGMDIESTKDQLLFKNNHECTKTKLLYTENPNFNPRKYPYYKDKKSEINCANVDCNDPLQSRQCLHKCSDQIIESKNTKIFDIKNTNTNDLENKPKIIDKDGWINDPNWIRVCKEKLADNNVLTTNNKQIYCLKYKSKDIEKPYDEETKTRDNILGKVDVRRQGKRSYRCDDRPNWLMEETKNKIRSPIKNNLNKIINNYNQKFPNGESVYTYPYHLIYGDTLDTNKNKNKNKPNEKVDTESGGNPPFNYPNNNKIYDEIMKAYRDDLYISWGGKDLSERGKDKQLSRGILEHNYKEGTGRSNVDGWCCNDRYGYGKSSFNNNNNKVNECVNDYNVAMNIADPKNGELSETNNHGWYMLPNSEETDPNYNGYYIDENNNNTKYLVNDNAVAKASKFLGTIDNHRVSHDGVCEKNIQNIPDLKYFCNGPNSNNPLYNKVCNQITDQHSKIKQCMNEKQNIDIIDSLVSEQTETPPLTEDELLQSTEDLETCIQQNNGESLIDVNTEENDTSDSTYKKLNELDELNYFIQPSKDDSGNLIKSNTYFHAHKHIHSNM